MDTKSFKNLCDRLLKKNGFKKRRNMYYKDGIDGIRCGVYLQRSAYGKLYYFNYYYLVDNSDEKAIPSYLGADIYGRITVVSKIEGENNCYQTDLIEYELYEEKELEKDLEKGIQDEILLPLKMGRKVILDMMKKNLCVVFKFRKKEEEIVLKKLYNATEAMGGKGQKA